MRTILLDLPPSVKGFTTETEDENIIVLNSRLSYEQNKETYIHELKHISYQDLRRICDVGLLEAERH